MRVFHSSQVISLTLAALFALPVYAAKPVHLDSGLPFGNGFPSGTHFNLNMLGKKYGYNCPPPAYDASGAESYGNVIMVPRWSGEKITVLVESGKKGPKSAPDTTTLEVTDWCSESFSYDGEATGDPAAFRLPYHDDGYGVYARITGKPGTNGGPSAEFNPPELYYVEDEAGNNLVLLGLVNKDGVSTVTADGIVVRRTSTDDSGKKGKGVQKATDLSYLFKWYGEICYLQSDTDEYCLDDSGLPLCEYKPVCCVDEDGDGTCESYVTSVDGATCPVPLLVACRTYTAEWIFNIGDFVGTLWPFTSSGAYNIQIRFYPI